MDQEKNIETKEKNILETANFYFEKVRMVLGIIIVVVLTLNAFWGYSVISSAIKGKNDNSSYNNPFSFLFTVSTPKQDPNFKIDYDEKQAGHMYGAKFTNQKGIFGFIENYIQVYKIKKGVDRDFINTSKELSKQYENH